MDCSRNKTKSFFVTFALIFSNQSFSKILTSPKEEAETEFKKQKPELDVAKKNDSSLSKRNEPGLFYRSDEIETFIKKQFGELSGNVFIEHGELSLETQKAFLYFDKTKTIYLVKTQNPTKILKIKTKDSEEIQAYCETAYYYPIEKKLTLDGNVKIIRPEEVIEGDHIDYYLESEELKGKKITGVLNSKEKKKSS